MKNRIITLFWSLVFLMMGNLSAQTVSVWDGSSEIWTQGSGTEADPYLIETAANLAWIAEMVNAGVTTYEGVYFMVVNDLDLNNLQWSSIGNSRTLCFKGYFDGGGHLIDNVKNGSLFGYVSNAVVKKVQIKKVSTTGAGLVRYAITTIIDNCHIRSGNVTGGGYAGGIVAYCEGECPIERCSNAANITSSGNVLSAGGICGYQTTAAIITNCHNTGSISITKTTCSNDNYTVYAGGICGYGGGSFTSCSNRGSVRAENQSAYHDTPSGNSSYTHYYSTSSSGGICGSGGDFVFCYNVGAVSSLTHYSVVNSNTPVHHPSGNSYGIGPGRCNYCYNRGDITASSNASNTSNSYGVGTSNVHTYNTGHLIGSSRSGGGYYLETCGATSGGTSKTEAAMKSSSFPILLNADSTVFVMDITPNVNDGFPIFNTAQIYLVTQEVNSITFNSATLQGIYQTGSVDVVGFEYKPSTADNFTTVYTNIGTPVSYNLIDLQPNTTYDYRLFVQKDGVTYYGDVVSFTTLACDLQASVTSSVSEMCNGNSATLTASCSSEHSNSFTYRWNNDVTGNILQVNDGETYTVTVQDTNGCSATASVSVTILPIPQGNISGSTSLCAGQSTTLTASGANRYNWSTGASTPTLNVSQGGVYTCTFTNSYNCTMTQSVEVTVFDSPTISGELGICEGTTTTLTATGGDSYVWSTGANTPSIQVSTAGSYTVTASTGNGCSGSATVNVLQNPTPDVQISGNTIICSGISTTLTATNAESYLWSTGSTEQSVTAYNPGTYTVTVTNATGCINSASINVTTMENVSIIGTQSICEGQSTTLSVSTSGNYQWSTGANTSFITVFQPGAYSVTVSLPNGCSSNASANVVSVANPTPSITGTTVFCEGQSTMLYANGGNSYQWSTGTTGNNLPVSEAGTYTVTATNAQGCSATASTYVTVNPLPNITITGNNTTCQGNVVTLTANGAQSYQWNNGSTNATITVGTAGNFSVTGYSSQGCSSTASTSVTVYPTYNTPISQSICEGETYNFFGQNLSTAGTYTYPLYSIHGCDSVITLTLTVREAPVVSISGNTNFCQGESGTLVANGGVSYQWSNGVGGSTVYVNESGAYTVTATNAQGCSATATAYVTVNELPTITISGNTAVCQGNTTTLTANGAVSYQWSNGVNSATNTIGEFGNYTVTGTSAAGCSSTATTTVIVYSLPVIHITGNTEICQGSTATLTANGAETYLWNNGTTDATLTTSNAGTYTVIGTDEHGCYSTESVVVVVNYPANEDIYVSENGSYEWHDSTYTESGDYTWTGQTIHGCDSTVTLHLTITPADTTGITTYNGSDLTLYPNPTTGIVNVQCSMDNAQSGNVEIRVYDVYGKLIETTHALSPQPTAQIDLSRYSSGIYIIKLENNGRVVATGKVVKQ